MRAGFEECDDGNTEDGDGCSGSCTFEDVANATADGSWDCIAQDSALPVNVNDSEVTNSSRRAVQICYRDVCKRTALFVEVQAATATAAAVTAAVGTVSLP